MSLALKKTSLLASGVADGNGTAIFNLPLNVRRRGLVLQAFDLGVCATSNLAASPCFSSSLLCQPSPEGKEGSLPNRNWNGIGLRSAQAVSLCTALGKAR
jgi:hypothetical protein